MATLGLFALNTMPVKATERVPIEKSVAQIDGELSFEQSQLASTETKPETTFIVTDIHGIVTGLENTPRREKVKVLLEARKVALSREQAQKALVVNSQSKEQYQKDKDAKAKADAEKARIAKEKEEAERARIAKEKEEAEKARIAKEQADAEKARIAKEQANAERAQNTAETVHEPVAPSEPAPSGQLAFGADGLLIESATSAAQQVINLELGIPNHMNGAGYHQATGLDALIDQLTIPEAVYAIHRMEGAGFGQTGDGWAGVDSPASHQSFVNNQVNRRFGGDIKLLLKKWGTYSYGGY